MKTSSNRLPDIKPRFFLRRWVDRTIVDYLGRVPNMPMSSTGEMHSGLSVFLVALPLLLVGAGCLVGIFSPSIWMVAALFAAVLAWPIRWALRPWVVAPDEDTVRSLVPNQYQLLQDFMAPEQLEQIVAWAAQDPYFDTRHLLACMDNNGTSRRAGRFTGINALDLFDGLVGRRVAAIQQSADLQDAAPHIETSPAAVRRF